MKPSIKREEKPEFTPLFSSRNNEYQYISSFPVPYCNLFDCFQRNRPDGRG
uniref:Uncharacterized protein n=1 Tax=Rhizophora mucronata TaxID=61149 RepID=A0A2P2PQS4_RHIMU